MPTGIFTPHSSCAIGPTCRPPATFSPSPPQHLKTLFSGPGRHGIGHNLFAYHRAPNGLITELFAELDQVNEELGYFEPRPWHRDHPQKPKVGPKDPSASNL